SVIGITEQKVTQHILFATDFSPGAQGVSLYLEQLLATGTVKEVTLLHVQDRSRIEPHLVDRIDEFNKTDKERLQELKGRLEAGSDVSVTPKLVYGDPHTEVMREITESGATMVMMGTQGRGFFKELFVGSVSQFVARRSPIPVLLIPLPAESS
ncbi:MAG: universal stress protein, partial [Sphaerochaetaceae bacterium]